MYSYTVRCAFAKREAMEGFLAWLRDRHVADVCAAGAADAEIVVLDRVGGSGRPQTPADRDADPKSDPSSSPMSDHPHIIDVRYRFASREAFKRYESEQAPRLRADGLAELARLAVPSGEVKMTRTTGDVIAWR